MIVELPELKIGDNIWLIGDNGIKKEKTKHFFFWEKEKEEDTYSETSFVVRSISDDGLKFVVNGVTRYAHAPNGHHLPSLFGVQLPFRKTLTKEEIDRNWIKSECRAVIIKRVNDTIFENNREICRFK